MKNTKTKNILFCVHKNRKQIFIVKRIFYFRKQKIVLRIY